MKILIDNGHGCNTAGKCSPDLRLREYKYTREIAAALVAELRDNGMDAELLTPEETDISISERVKRANLWCAKLGAANVVVVSLHCNASGADGKWHLPNGWSSHLDMTASKKSQRLATYLTEAAKQQGLCVRQPLPGQAYWVQSLGISRNTKCPAVLTENLFQDNKQDVDFLLSEDGRRKIVALHVAGIKNYIGKKK